MAKHAIIKFPAGNITVKILKSPVTDIWLKELENWQNAGIPMSTQRGLMLHHGWEGLKRRSPKHERECVQGINDAIDEVNSLLTEGSTLFPYRAWADMPWSQTNKIHRCFTLGLVTRGNLERDIKIKPGGIWHHDLTQEELKLYTEEYCYDNKHYVKYNADGKQQFWYEDKDHFKLDEALEKINMWVHLYENARYSDRAGIFQEQEAPKYMEENDIEGNGPVEINLTWDNYTEDGGREFTSLASPTSQEFTDSIPERWMNYDVFAIKSITGKDYETAYQNYDDPTEYDIQNVQDITGALRIFPNSGHRLLYGDSGFGNWVRSYGIDFKNYAPVPIGKIVKTDFNLLDIDSVEGEYNTDGSGAVQERFRNPKIEIIEVEEREDSTYPEEVIEDKNNFI